MNIWHEFSNEYINDGYLSKNVILKELMIEMDTFVGTKKQIEEKEHQIRIVAEDTFKKGKEEFHQRQNDLVEKFKQTLYKNTHKDIPLVIKEKAYNKAWNIGHSIGGYEIENCYFKIVYEYFELYELGKASQNES